MTATTVSPETPLQQKIPAAPIRLEFLDGLRGLAALYVVLHHCVEEVEPFDGPHYSHWLRLALKPLNLGHYSVGIFIVLSGYCLMLPVARSAGKTLKGGFQGYILRRAKRILPPYYAALALTLCFILLVPATRNSDATQWSGNRVAFQIPVIVSHLLVAHNLSDAWSHRINAPMWSVATEWQIYFLFALILLPVWRRFGNLALLAVAVALGLALTFAFPVAQSACFWYIGLFAFGMVAATRLGKTGEAETRLWGVAAFAAVTALFGLSLVTSLKAILIQSDFITGVFGAALILYCAGRAQHGGSRLLRVLESKAALWLGMFSYSLYLIHFPVLSTLHLALNAAHLSILGKLLAELTLGVGLSLAVGYGFYLLVERHFVRGHRAVKI